MPMVVSQLHEFLSAALTWPRRQTPPFCRAKDKARSSSGNAPGIIVDPTLATLKDPFRGTKRRGVVPSSSLLSEVNSL